MLTTNDNTYFSGIDFFSQLEEQGQTGTRSGTYRFARLVIDVCKGNENYSDLMETKHSVLH